MRQLSERMQKFLRPDSSVFQQRMGNVIILIPGISKGDEYNVAQEIRASASGPMTIESIPVHADLSVGVASSSPSDSIDVWEPIRRATAAQIHAFERDRGVVVFDINLKTQRRTTLSLLGELQRAIDEDELFLELPSEISYWE